MAQWVKNLTATAQVAAQVWSGSRAPHRGLKGVAAAAAQLAGAARIQSLAQELPYATGVATKLGGKKICVWGHTHFLIPSLPNSSLRKHIVLFLFRRFPAVHPVLAQRASIVTCGGTGWRIT